MYSSRALVLSTCLFAACGNDPPAMPLCETPPCPGEEDGPPVEDVDAAGGEDGAIAVDLAGIDLAGFDFSGDLSAALDAGVDSVVPGTPAVINVAPPSGDTISVGQSITITFSEAMNAGSLALGGTLAAAATPSWPSPTELVLTPTSAWPASAGAGDVKTLRVDATSATGGVALATLALAYLVDATAPSLIDVVPDSGASLGSTQPIVLIFDESINPASFSGVDGTMAARVGTTAFSQTVFANDTLTLTPTGAGWANGGAETLILRTELADVIGNVMAGQTLTFAIDATAPVFSAVTPLGDRIDWGTTLVLTFSENLSSNLADHVIGGTLTTSASFTASVSGATLTLTPGPHWNPDSGRMLSVVVRDLAGNASAPVALIYHVFDGAVYVKKTGDDANPGTPSLPKLTIAAALTAADNMYDAAQVRVAAGVYQTGASLTVPNGIELYGGYNPADWSTPPSRTAYETRIEDTRASGFSYTVILQPNTRLQRFKVISANGVSGGNSCVSLAQNLTGVQRVIDNELISRTFSESNSIRATSDLNIVEIRDNIMLGTNTNGDNNVIKLAINGGAAPNITIDNNDIRVSDGSFTTSNAIEARPNTSHPTSGTMTISNNYIRGGAATKNTVIGEGDSYGLQLTLNNMTYIIDRNRIHGGTGAMATAAIFISAVGTSSTITRNAVHGGEPQVDGKSSVGMHLTGTTKVWNNLVTGGGRTSGATIGDSTAIHLFTQSASVLNNTVHNGFLSRGSAVAVNSQGTKINNNIFLASGYLGGQFVVAVREIGNNSPLQLRNNRFQGFDSGTAYAYEDYFGSGLSCPTVAGYNCYRDETSLNTEANTTGGAAGTAEGNTVGSAGFADVDGADNLLGTLFDANGVIENQWGLNNSSAIKATGIDGAAAGEAFGFTDDYTGLTRTGNGTTGWSIGAYENNN